MKSFSYVSYIDSFDDIKGVLNHMQTLQEELESSDLHNLKYFNRTYMLITQIVSEYVPRNYFNNSKQMNDFDISFAKLYFSALKNYTENKKVPPAWKICFDECRGEKLEATKCLGLGANAHINNDLPEALENFPSDKDLQIDYNKVNNLILIKIPLVLEELHESAPLFRAIQKSGVLYIYFIYAIVCLWRRDAWLQFKKLKSKKRTKSNIENKAEKIAKVFIKKGTKKFSFV